MTTAEIPPRPWALRARTAAAKGLRGRVAGLSLLATLTVATVALLLPPADQTRARFDAVAIDSVADSDLAAPHDFVFERADTEGIDAARALAAAAEPTVWDHDERLYELTEGRIRRVFGVLRSAIERAENPDGSGEGSGAPSRPLSGTRRVQVVEDAGGIAEIVTPEQSVPRESVVRELAREGFSREAEAATVALVESVMRRHVVEHARALDGIGTNGIILRTLTESGTTEEPLVNFRDVYDIADVPGLVYQASAHIRDIDDADVVDAIEDLAIALISVNTRYNEAETARRQVAAAQLAEEEYRRQQRVQFRQGELVVREGEVITPARYAVLQSMYTADRPTGGRGWHAAGLALLVVLIVGPLTAAAKATRRGSRARRRDMLMTATVLLSHLALARTGRFVADAVMASGAEVPAQAAYGVLPFAAGAMIVRLLTNAEAALVYAVVSAVLTGALFRFDVTFVIMSLVAGVVGSMLMGTARSRSDILRAGFVAGVAVMGVHVASMLARGEILQVDAVPDVLLPAVSGLTSTIVVFSLLPLFELALGYTTSLRLMELANLNHPLMRELILKAPGTYHHSMMVGQLVEAACEAVGADALLGRVGSYFHDIGKMKTPHYFAENQSGSNPHSKLRPNMSALVIKAHVKDGVEMARQHGLPEEIVAFIREHHGTSLISFFFHRAQEESADEVNENDYRYSGPRPQSRETAICLLADGIEAASRALPEPSPAHLKGLVQRMINNAFIDGQLDECDLTLRDLDLIANAFYTRLAAFYHHRPEYPGTNGRTRGTRNTRSLAAAVAEEGVTSDDRADQPGEPAAVDSGVGDVASRATGTPLRRLRISPDRGGVGGADG
jgi:putative nucleotidyltransferase with HDIG domain